MMKGFAQGVGVYYVNCKRTGSSTYELIDITDKEVVAIAKGGAMPILRYDDLAGGIVFSPLKYIKGDRIVFWDGESFMFSQS